MENIENKLDSILSKYSSSFKEKCYKEESEETDVLMEAFGITQELKKENKQYWGRELGMCWQLIVTEIFRNFSDKFKPAIKYGDDEPADFFVDKDAVDTKYRVGSGDSGTLKKFKQYGQMLKQEGYNPVFLFLRTDNLPAALTACNVGGWQIYAGDGSFEYILKHTGFDLKKYLIEAKQKNKCIINRQ